MTQKTKKASILAFTLIMLGILLAAGLSLMGATLVDQRTAIDSGKAIQSLQTAESGTDIAVSRISNAPTSNLSVIFPASSGYTWNGNTVTASAAQGNFTLTFLDKDGNELSSSTNGSEVESIKSIGTYAGINRAIEVAMAATSDRPCGSVLVDSRAFNFREATGCVIDNTPSLLSSITVQTGTSSSQLPDIQDYVENHCISVSGSASDGWTIYHCYN